MKLHGLSVTKLLELMDKGEVTAEEVSAYFGARVEKSNATLNAYLTIPPLSDTVFGKKGSKGSLLNIPLAVKDNFCTKGIRTTASANVLDNFVPPYDATVITRLKSAGALIQGKTNMDAWAHGSSTETSDFGPSKNPWDISRAPGGSSGGTAAAVSAYLAPAGIGSETAGSIRLPAAWCGIVGVKPTYGRVSRYGVIAMGSSLDCPGPMTTTVEDSALILQAIAGPDPYDATTASEPVPDYSAEMKKRRKMTIGVSDEYLDGVDDDVKKNYEECLKVLEKMGHKIKKIELISPSYAISVYTIIQRAEVSSNLGRYDGIRFGNGRDTFGAEAKRRVMLGTYTLSHGYYDAFYKKAQKVRTLIIEDFKRAFKEVDAIFAPTTPVTALALGEFEKYPFFGEKMDVLNEPGAVSGIPAINIPTGLDRHGLPIGMQLQGNYFQEGALLDLAYQFEQETNFFDVIKNGMKHYND